MKSGGGPPGRPASDEGLTLVEVVVALLVLTAGLLAVAGMTTAVGTRSRDAAARTDQVLLAQERLGRAAAGGWDQAVPGTSVDTASRGGRSWVVTVAVSRPVPRLKEVRVTVGGIAGIPDRTFVLALARPRPLAD